MLFALFGIPLNVVILNKVGKCMLAIERSFCNFLEKKIDRGVRIELLFFTVSKDVELMNDCDKQYN